jgi:putative chitinase
VGIFDTLLRLLGKLTAAPAAQPVAPQPSPQPQTPQPTAQAAAPVAPAVALVKPAAGVGITVAHLTGMGAKLANAEKYVVHLNEACVKFDINTRSRICHFIAQVYQESGNLRVVREDLNYTAKNCMDVWPSTFPTVESTVGYTMNPAALANKKYGGKNGNTAPGDGWKYSGRGLIQVTFLGNYRPCGKFLGIDLVSHPELLEEPKWAAMSAGWFFGKHANCNPLADRDNLETVRLITKKVNGGSNHLEQREDHWKRAQIVFADLN